MNFKCNPCNISFQSDILYQAHLYSSSHEINVKNSQKRGATAVISDECRCSTYIQKYAYGYVTCTLCQVPLNSFEQVRTHVSGQKHRKLLPGSCRSSGSMCTEKAIAACKNVSRTVQVSNTECQYLCVECKCSTYIQKCKGGYVCTLCKVPLNSFEQVRMHVTGQKHLKLLPCKCSPDKAFAACKNISNAIQDSNTESLSSDRVKLFPSTLSSYGVPAENILSKVTFFNVEDEVCF